MKKYVSLHYQKTNKMKQEFVINLEFKYEIDFVDTYMKELLKKFLTENIGIEPKEIKSIYVKKLT